MITVNSRKYDGTIQRSWKCEFIERRGSLLIFVGEFDFAVDHNELGSIDKGTMSYEYYWFDRWYNVFRFHEPNGDLKSFYFNISMPPDFANGVLNYIDLDIDILVQPDLTYTVLDQDDFDKNAHAFGYSVDVKERVEQTLDELIRAIEDRNLPGLPELFATSGVKLCESR